jgi:hypothetical protein
MHEAGTRTATAKPARMGRRIAMFARSWAALGVVPLVAGCMSPYDHSYRSPSYYARPYPPTYQQQPLITPYPSQPATVQPRDTYEPSPEPQPSVEIGWPPDQEQRKITQQDPEVLIPEPNNGPPPGSRTILHPFPDMRSP